jgi:hypothetical protein
MARPAGRGRTSRARDEDDDPGDRRGRSAAPAPSGPGPGVILGGVALVVVAIVVAVVAANSGKKKPVAAPPPLAPPPKKVEAPPPPPPPAKALPKPLTAEEKSFIEGLFKKAAPHIESFRAHAKAGWEQDKKGEKDAANEEWIDAKHAFQEAVQIVNEALEDEDRFPGDRPGMSTFNQRLAVWQKEMSDLPKVNVTR